MKVIYKFNNGNGATLCNECRTVITTGKKVEKLYCDKCQDKVNNIVVNFYNQMDKEVLFNRGNLNK
jgi:hypothetical protein